MNKPPQHFEELNSPIEKNSKEEFNSTSKKGKTHFLIKQNILFPTLNKNTFEY